MKYAVRALIVAFAAANLLLLAYSFFATEMHNKIWLMSNKGNS